MFFHIVSVILREKLIALHKFEICTKLKKPEKGCKNFDGFELTLKKINTWESGLGIQNLKRISVLKKIHHSKNAPKLSKEFSKKKKKF